MRATGRAALLLAGRTSAGLAPACASTEAWSFIQIHTHRLQPTEPSLAPEKAAPVFDDKTVALARMLYGFYMVASCHSLFDEFQLGASSCKLCREAGFAYAPGEIRLILPRRSETVGLVARLKMESGGYGCLLAIRGTSTFGNLVSDFDIAPTAFHGCKGCRVHDGWLQQWKSLAPHVREGLSQLQCSGRPLYVTGHSSGCAVSDFAAMELQAAGFPLNASVGFDCPRPGDAHFAKAFDAAFHGKVWKVQVDLDPIRHLPPAWTGYRAVGWAVQYRHEGDAGYRVCGKGEALCPGDHAPRLGDDLAGKIRTYHCAAPHQNTWGSEVYMGCDAKCNATLLEPEWQLASKVGKGEDAALLAEKPDFVVGQGKKNRLLELWHRRWRPWRRK